MIPKVLVIMSTYNGERYLGEQIESILMQKDIEIELVIRDDGSTDGTVEIIEKYAKENENIAYEIGENIGAAQSFLSLLYNVDMNDSFNYIAFCDQDDIWESNKLSMAINKLNQFSIPALYYSALNTFNDITGQREKIVASHQYTLAESMIRSSFPGCTMVINRMGILLLHNVGKPRTVVMHDSFIYQVFCASNCKIVYDSNSYINYRIHGDNYSICERGFWNWYKHIKNIAKKQKGLRSAAARELYRLSPKFAAEKAIQIFKIFSEYQDNLIKHILVIQYLIKMRFNIKIKMEFIIAILCNIY